MILLRVQLTKNGDSDMRGRGAITNSIYALVHKVLLQQIVKMKGIAKKIKQCEALGPTARFFVSHICDKFSYQICAHSASYRFSAILQLLRSSQKHKQILFNRFCYPQNC